MLQIRSRHLGFNTFQLRLPPDVEPAVSGPQALVDKAQASIAAVVDLKGAVEHSSTPELFVLHESALPVQQLPAYAVTALRGVLPAWRSSRVVAEGVPSEENLPTKQALQVYIIQ